MKLPFILFIAAGSLALTACDDVRVEKYPNGNVRFEATYVNDKTARYGVNVNGGTIYITLSPCLTCAKLIINAGIAEVVYGGDYTAFLDTVKEMFRQAGVKCRSFALKEC